LSQVSNKPFFLANQETLIQTVNLTEFTLYPGPFHEHLTLASVFKIVFIVACVCLFAGGKN